MRGPGRWVQDPRPAHADRLALGVLALAAYVPILVTAIGRVSADTKTYLTVDPGEVLRQAVSMWDPSVGAGTVPHQNIGFLFPLGPFYWLTEQIGVPDWLTQRLIWGTLVFAAAAGAYRLARWMRWTPSAALIVGVAYGFSPYVWSYLARLSVILGPWAALPWMILLAAKAARTRSWRPAAQFAVVVALVGSVNATSLVLAGIGPIAWLVADVVARRVRTRDAVRAAARIGVLCGAISAWWIVALRIQGGYGIPILRYTESYQAVASASTPAEIVRGLGYWFFYGADRLDPWVGPSGPYVDNPALIVVGFVLAAIGLLGFTVPFVGRATMAALVVIGLGVSVGAAPLGSSSPYGRLFEWFATDTTAGLALRSTPRAAPLLLLALAFGLGSSSAWASWRLAERRRSTQDAPAPARGMLAPIGLVLLLGFQFSAWFTTSGLTPPLLRDEQLPEHVLELASWLDGSDRSSSGRVYEMPAADFASHRWGGTVDPVLPGLIERPYLARELVPQGGAGTADLLNAIERRIPEGWFEPEGLPALVRLLGVETVVVRNDLEHERYQLARPGQLWTDLTSALGEPDHAGPLVTDEPQVPVLDERTLAHPEAAEQFPVVAAFDRPESPSLATRPAGSPVVLAGSGDGIVDLAGAQLLDPERPLLFAATLDDLAVAGDLDPSMLGDDPWWVFSDTNRKQGRHWSGVSNNLGALESDGPLVLDDDPGDNQLDLFGPGLDRQTFAVHEAEVADVRASYYGNRIAYTPEDAPWYAIDGDPTTAWRAGVFATTAGLVWEADLDEAVMASTVTLVQPITGAVGRYVTRVGITLDRGTGTESFEVDLDERSRAATGQVIPLPSGPLHGIRLEVLADNVGDLSSYAAQPGVGFAEVVIPGVRDDRVVRVPGLEDFDGLSTMVTDELADQRMTYLFTRQRLDPATPNRTSPEQKIIRRFEVPDERRFELIGEARLSAASPDATLAGLFGDSAIADARLPGSPAARGASATDGHLATAWHTPFDDVIGSTLTVPGLAGVAEELTVAWLDDETRSIPTELTITGGDGQVQQIAVPTTAPVDGVATATIDTLPIDTSSVAITVTGIEPRTTPEYFSSRPRTLPIAVAELQIGAAANDPADPDVGIDTACRDDLIRLDGRPLPVRVVGTRGEALAGSELRIEACATVVLAAGPHRLEAAPGAPTGIDIDRLVLDSRPTPSTSDPVLPPALTIEAEGATTFEARVAASTESTWLILEQSWNVGWTAQADGADLGAPVLIDGFANGWLLPPSDVDRAITLEWQPQNTLVVALWFSLVAGCLVLLLAVLGRRESVRLDTTVDDVGPQPPRRRWSGPVFVAAIAFFAGPFVAIIAAAILVAAARLRWLASVVIAAAFAVVAGGVALLQWHYTFPPFLGWPERFGWTAPLVWVAVAAAAGCVVADRPDHVADTRELTTHPADELAG